MLEEDDYLKGFIPEYRAYSIDNLLYLSSKYPSVFLKQDVGLGAKGVLKISRLENEYSVEDADGNASSLALDDFPKYLNELHIIQQGIDSLGFNNRSLEFRVYAQKLKDDWEIMGIIPKVAKEGLFSPTLNRGGESLFFDDVFPGNNELLDKITNVTLKIGNTINLHLPGLREMGIDFGIDKQEKLWIFEVNTAPATITFKPLDSKKYQLVVSNKKKIISESKIYSLNDILPSPSKKRCGSCRKTRKRRR